MPGRFSQLCLDNYWCLVGFLNSALTPDSWSVFSTLPWHLMPGRFSQLCLDDLLMAGRFSSTLPWHYWCLVGFLNSVLTPDAWSVFSTLPWHLMPGRFSQLCLDTWMPGRFSQFCLDIWCLVGFLNSALTLDAWSIFSTLPWQLLMSGRLSQLCLDTWCQVGFLNSALTSDAWSVFSTLPWHLDAWSIFSTLPWQLLMSGRLSQLCLDTWCQVGFLKLHGILAGD